MRKNLNDYKRKYKDYLEYYEDLLGNLLESEADFGHKIDFIGNDMFEICI
jgi:hypothetical protein